MDFFFSYLHITFLSRDGSFSNMQAFLAQNDKKGENSLDSSGCIFGVKLFRFCVAKVMLISDNLDIALGQKLG